MARIIAPGIVTDEKRPEKVVAERAEALATAADGILVSKSKRILFGDLHVHTTFSFDAFILSLPLPGGEGTHLPADACDFARFCSALDFWPINDHAESISQRHWRETVETIRACNEVSGGTAEPDDARFGRDTVYYVRALEAPAPGVNAGGLQCERDAAGE